MRTRIFGAGFVLAFTVAGCTDKAEVGYRKCIELEAQGNVQSAYDECNGARGADPDTKYGKLAAAKMAELQAKLDKLKADQAKAAQQAAQAEAAAKQAAFEKAGGWKALPTKFKKMFYAQASSDLTSGRATPVLDVITGEIGQPTGTYPDSVSVWYVWGTQLPSSASKDDIKAAPFSVRTRSGLACGDYAPNMVEFWLSGGRVWPD